MNWPAIVDAIRTTEFKAGLLAGMLFFGLMWMYSLVSKNRILWQCAQMKTPTKIGDGFYYIVPESMYNKLHVLKLQTDSRASDNKASSN